MFIATRIISPPPPPWSSQSPRSPQDHAARLLSSGILAALASHRQHTPQPWVRRVWLWWTFATEEDQDNENPNWILFLPMHCNVAGLIEEKVINMRNMMMDYLISDHWSQIHNTCRALPCPPTKIHHWEEGPRQILPEARIRNWLWKKSVEQCSVTITSLPFSLLSPPAPLPPTLPPPRLNLNRFGELTF